MRRPAFQPQLFTRPLPAIHMVIVLAYRPNGEQASAPGLSSFRFLNFSRPAYSIEPLVASNGSSILRPGAREEEWIA